MRRSGCGKATQAEAEALIRARPFRTWEEVAKVEGMSLGMIDDLKSGAAELRCQLVALAAVTLVSAACSGGAPPLSPDELAFRAAVAVRGDELDRALFCGADAASVVDAARQSAPPPTVSPAFAWPYRELLVARVEVTKNLRGSNGDNPECVTLRSRPDLARLWPAPPRTTPARAPTRPLPPPPSAGPS
jgi:hypothetical protein